MLIITNKFFKEKLFISDINTWKAKNWTLNLLRYLQLCNWRLSRVIISDRDSKFRFELWRWIFKTLNIDLLISTTYHSQTDDQSERINQTIEIALRYFLTSNSDLSWHEILSSLQQTFMNTKTFTEHSSNEILYEMNTRSQLILLNEDDVVMNNLTRDIIRKDVVNVIDFANVKAKIIYDVKHKSFAFNTDDKVYLRLHREYSLSKKKNSKLSNQRSESYIILRKVNNLTYELNISATTRIHFVISITQLKFVEDDFDSYDRSRFINSDSIETTKDILTKKSFEVEKLLKKRVRKYDRTTIIQYLIK